LTLRLICGLTTAEIALAFLVPEKTLGQRIFRAKSILSEAHVPFETPRGDELRRRLESVLSVVYLIFNEGYTATSGEEWMRATLCDDALRLGRMLVELLPGESEVHGLLALTELQASRTAARRGRSGEAILLLEQDRSLWDYSQIHRGMAALQHSQELGGGAGNYALQAAIAACHARAATAADTDWERILLLYDALLQISPSPIVALNRAVAGGIERVCPYLPEKQGYGDSLLDCSSLLCCSWLHPFQKSALQDGQTGHARMHRSDGKGAAINGSGYPPSPGLVGVRRQIMQ